MSLFPELVSGPLLGGTFKARAVPIHGNNSLTYRCEMTCRCGHMQRVANFVEYEYADYICDGCGERISWQQCRYESEKWKKELAHQHLFASGPFGPYQWATRTTSSASPSPPELASAPS